LCEVQSQKLEELREVQSQKLEELREVQSQKLEELREGQSELSKSVQNVQLNQHIMNEKLPKLTEAFITPSEYKKSTHKEIFFDLMDMFGFGHTSISSQVETFNGAPPTNAIALDFKYRWEDGALESSSYPKLQEHLTRHGVDTVIVGEGQGLPDGLLYREELWTLKRNTILRSADLRKVGQESIFKYTLRGRTDLVRKKRRDDPLGKSNNRYFIEIKRGEDFVKEDSLREAVLQLIGGNASNTFHSPPVLLTNLLSMHFVLFITLEGDPTTELRFKLNVLKMGTFGVALAFVEEQTSTMRSVTSHMGRKPTPPSSPPKATGFGADDDDCDSVTDAFASADLREVVEEEDV